MKIHTELFGGPEDGKPIQLDSNNMPMEVVVPFVPGIYAYANQLDDNDDPTQPFVMQNVSYKLNKDGKYWASNG